jgi:parvulin-like peptidyl-prolyl isomerase
LENSGDKIAITVGDNDVTERQLKKYTAAIISDMGVTDQEAKLLIRTIIDKVIEKLLVMEYGRLEGITLGDDELEAAVDVIRGDYPEDAFNEMLVKRYIDFNEWSESLRQELLIKKIIETNVSDLSAVTFDEIKAYYESHIEEFKRSRMVQLRQVVTRASEEAERVEELLAEGQDIEKLAREYSITPEAENGGNLGWIEEGELEEEIEEVVFSLSPGEISDILTSSYGYHIFETLSHKEESFRSLTEAMEEIELKLAYEKREELYGKWIKELRDRFPVSIDEQIYTDWSMEG